MQFSAPGFPSQSTRQKSDSEMQGESFISGTLDINAVIRAYQVAQKTDLPVWTGLKNRFVWFLFKARGHLIADTDPLKLQNPDSYKLQGTANLPPAIVVRQHLKGMTEADMNREFPLAPFTVIGGPRRSLSLREILTRLNQVYCGHLGLEYTYIHDLVMVRLLKAFAGNFKLLRHFCFQLDWLRDKIEIPGAWDMPVERRKAVWMDIMRAVTFESFLARKYPTEKRFGLEGCETFISSMIECLETSAEHGRIFPFDDEQLFRFWIIFQGWRLLWLEWLTVDDWIPWSMFATNHCINYWLSSIRSLWKVSARAMWSTIWERIRNEC